MRPGDWVGVVLLMIMIIILIIPAVLFWP